MSDLALLALRSSWGLTLTWHAWVVVIALAYALILLAAWALVHGGTSKPTPRHEPTKPEQLRETGEEFDLVWRGGWRT